MIRTALAGRWAGRWADLLEQDPDAEAELQGFVQEIQATQPAERLSASDHAGFANGDESSYAAGPEHPGALATQSELAYSAGQAGDAVAARDQFAALLPVADASSAPSTPTPWPHAPALPTGSGRRGRGRRPGPVRRTAASSPARSRSRASGYLVSRHNLANFTGYAGDAAAARDQFAALLHVRERVFGADSPDTMVARFNLAYWTGRAGAAADARTSSPRCSLSASACMARITPTPWPHGGTRVLDRVRWCRGRRPGPVRRAAFRL